MPTVTVDVACAPDPCWAALVDADRFTAWMPNLRRVTVVSRHPDGLAREVAFDFSAALSYSLVYDYDHGKREVRWQPHEHASDAVRGFARVEPHAAGCRLTYKLEQGAHRKTGDLAIGGIHPVLDAFVRWIERQ